MKFLSDWGSSRRILFSVAGVNLITKQVATISGVAFTLVFFLIFMVSEHVNENGAALAAHVEVDQFRPILNTR